MITKDLLHRSLSHHIKEPFMVAIYRDKIEVFLIHREQSIYQPISKAIQTSDIFSLAKTYNQTYNLNRL